MIGTDHILQFAATFGCVTSKHVVAMYSLSDNRQVNRILARLTDAGYLERSGSIRREGPGKPTPVYTATRSGFAKAAIKPREVSSHTALTRSLLLSEMACENKDTNFSITIEDKDEIFKNFGLEYPHRDKWYAGNLVASAKSRPHVFVPFTDYQAAVRMCKEPDRREMRAAYHIIVSTDIADKVRSLAADAINPFGVYGIERDHNDWSHLGRDIINSTSNSPFKEFVLNQVKQAIGSLKDTPEKRLKLSGNIYIDDYETGLIFTE